MIARLRQYATVYLFGVGMFAAGAVCGAILGLTVSHAAFVAMLRMKGLL